MSGITFTLSLSNAETAYYALRTLERAYTDLLADPLLDPDARIIYERRLLSVNLTAIELHQQHFDIFGVFFPQSLNPACNLSLDVLR